MVSNRERKCQFCTPQRWTRLEQSGGFARGARSRLGDFDKIGTFVIRGDAVNVLRKCSYLRIQPLRIIKRPRRGETKSLSPVIAGPGVSLFQVQASLTQN